MFPGFHILDLIIVLIVASLIFKPEEFVPSLLNVLVKILVIITALIFGPRKTKKS